MRLFYRLIAFLFITLASCNDERPKIIKLVYFAGQNLTYDSLNNPHLSIRKYLEYTENSKIKVAKGHLYYDSIAPLFGLDKFFEMEKDSAIQNIINKTLVNKKFDSTYYGNESPWYYFFLYETSDNKIVKIGFHKKVLPDDLKKLYSYLDSLTTFKDRKDIKPFEADYLVVELEKELFRIHPPVTRVNRDSLKQLRYIEPKGKEFE
ncbi:MAG: hypothetical protein HXX16_20300 [Bacteroidales bacterium]|nr:hypothetical protein [Bacteroidales bacterium]